MRKANRARILLQADDGLTDEEIADALGVSISTIERTRKRFVQEALGCLNEHPRPGREFKLDDKAEARLIATACSQTPEDRKRWTLRLLADKAVELELCDSISHETIRQYLKKTNLSLGRKSNGAFRK
jgi:transposase